MPSSATSRRNRPSLASTVTSTREARAWRATTDEGDDGLVVVTGSLYAVGAARTACRRLGLLG